LWSVIKTFCAASAIMTSLLKRNLFIERTRIPQRYWARPVAPRNSNCSASCCSSCSFTTTSKLKARQQASSKNRIKCAVPVRPAPQKKKKGKRMHGTVTGTAEIEQKPEK